MYCEWQILSDGIRPSLSDAKLGFDAGDAIIDIDDFAGEGVELDVQVVEASVDARFQVAEPRFHAIESGVHGVPLDHVGEDSEQDGEGRDSDCEIELDVGH